MWHEGEWEPKPRTFSTEEKLNPDFIESMGGIKEDFEPGKILKP